MRIITPKGTINTESESITFMFDDDNQLSQFINILVTTPVKTSGMRIIPIIPKDKNLSELQSKILDVISGLDGAGGKAHESICDNAIESLKEIIK